jgi:hypothetical protein
MTCPYGRTIITHRKRYKSESYVGDRMGLSCDAIEGTIENKWKSRGQAGEGGR